MEINQPNSVKPKVGGRKVSGINLQNALKQNA
jgi:hypothetical protein